jgi:hypothetical protein
MRIFSVNASVNNRFTILFNLVVSRRILVPALFVCESYAHSHIQHACNAHWYRPLKINLCKWRFIRVKGILSSMVRSIARKIRCVLIYGKLAKDPYSCCYSIAKRDWLRAYLARRTFSTGTLRRWWSRRNFRLLYSRRGVRWWRLNSRSLRKTALRHGCMRLTRENSISRVCTHTYTLVYLSPDLEGCTGERAKFPARAFRERVFRQTRSLRNKRTRACLCHYSRTQIIADTFKRLTWQVRRVVSSFFLSIKTSSIDLSGYTFKSESLLE